MTREFTPDPALKPTPEFKADEYVTLKKETGLDAMAGDGGYKEGTLAGAIRMKMKREGKRFWAGDNISEYVHFTDVDNLIDEATVAFEKVLDSLLIDRETDQFHEAKNRSALNRVRPIAPKGIKPGSTWRPDILAQSSEPIATPTIKAPKSIEIKVA